MVEVVGNKEVDYMGLSKGPHIIPIETPYRIYIYIH